MHKPRVLVLNHFAAPPGEAGGTRHIELFSRLKYWRFLIIAGDLNPQTGRRVGDSPGFMTVPVIEYIKNGPSRILNWTSYAFRAVQYGLRAGPVEVVYGSSPHLLAALAAWMLSVRKNAPFVLEVRDVWPKVLADMHYLDEKSMLFKILTQLEHFLYARATTIVIMATGVRAELVSRGIPNDKIVYIPNGADPQDFQPSSPREHLRARYGFSRTTAVYTGAHGPANGLDLLIDAAKTAPGVDVVLVGGGIRKRELVLRVKRETIRNVRFIDPIPKSEIPDLLAAADIGLHILADVPLFRSAVSPNKIFDYMAAGLPILTNCPGLVAQLVEDAGAGEAVEPDKIAEGLSALQNKTRNQMLQIGDNGRAWISLHQTRTAMAQRLERVLDNAQKKDGARP